MVTPEKFQQHLKESHVSWGGSYVVMRKLIQERGLKIGAEIGIGYGGNAENILKNTDIKKLYGVDPFTHSENANSVMNVCQEDFNDIYGFVKQKLSPFSDRFELIRKTSVKASDEVPNNLDFVYIDGEHSYEGVFSDLCAWTKKIRIGGIIAGHDYNHPNLPGIKKAVDEFLRRFGWEIHTEDNFVWWVEKKPINISFFIPTYNYGKPIREAVDSIMKGNFTPDDELIIFNDGSTDNTAKYLAELKTEYPEIKILTHAENKGPSATRNDAIEACGNPIVFSHDHDNILVPGSIAKLKEFFINSGADVAAFGELHYFTSSTDNVKDKWIFKEGFFALKDCLNGSVFPGASGNYMFTKESWLRAGGYPDSWLDSWGLGVRQIATGSKMIALPNTFYWHRYHHDHGYESTYIKGIRTGRISSLAALQILIPFLQLLDPKSVNYIMSKQGRNIWWGKLKKKPLRVRFNTLEEYGEFINNKEGHPSVLRRAFKKLRRTAKKIEPIRKSYIKLRRIFKSIL